MHKLLEKQGEKLAEIRKNKKTLAEIRKKPGESNAGKYPKVKKSDFAGPDGTYPINTKARAEAALRLAHNSPDEASIRKKVLAKYPSLLKK
jgi:hypothetical protein